jgi:hypothetical protein
MTDYTVIFDGTPNRPLGRHLFVEEWPRVAVLPPATFNSRPQADLSREGHGRRAHRHCAEYGCQKRVDAPTDEFCRMHRD